MKRWFFDANGKLLICSLNIIVAVLWIAAIGFNCSKSKNANVPASEKVCVEAPAKSQTEIRKEDLAGIWGVSEVENATFQITGDTIYYPDADRQLAFKLFNDSFICYAEDGDTDFVCTIVKVNKDSLVMQEKSTKETRAYVKIGNN